MADMYDSGVYCFNTWAKQEPAPNGKIFWNRWLGKFDPNLTAEEANKRCDHVGKITIHGQQSFMRGWEDARMKMKKERR